MIRFLNSLAVTEQLVSSCVREFLSAASFQREGSSHFSCLLLLLPSAWPCPLRPSAPSCPGQQLPAGFVLLIFSAVEGPVEPLSERRAWPCPLPHRAVLTFSGLITPQKTPAPAPSMSLRRTVASGPATAQHVYSFLV